MTEAQGADASPPDVRAAGARRVLVADDSVDAAESLGMLLELRGHEVRMVHTGRQAIELSATFRPDVVLLDITLPDMSGYEVARALLAAANGAPPMLVALTGHSREEDRRRAREAGFDLHLTKPVEPATILGLLGGPPAARTPSGPVH